MKKLILILFILISFKNNAQEGYFKPDDFCFEDSYNTYTTCIYKDTTYNPEDTIILVVLVNYKINIFKEKYILYKMKRYLINSFDKNIRKNVVILPILVKFYRKGEEIEIEEMVELLNEDELFKL